MKTVCAGYRDFSGRFYACGKVIKDGDESKGISHGICEDCFEKFKKDLEARKAA